MSITQRRYPGKPFIEIESLKINNDPPEIISKKIETAIWQFKLFGYTIKIYK